MREPISAINGEASTTSSNSEQRTIVLSGLARIIARSYSKKAAADKNVSMAISPPNSQSYSGNDISNGDRQQP